MAIVVWFDRDTGEILKVDDYPDWPPREVFMNWYREHPEEIVEGAGILTVPENVSWDGDASAWIVSRDGRGNPKLMRREEYDIEREIERAKELATLKGALQHIHPKAKSRLLKIIQELENKAL